MHKNSCFTYAPYVDIESHVSCIRIQNLLFASACKCVHAGVAVLDQNWIGTWVLQHI